MFTIYYSNDLDVQKNILLTLMQNTLDDPFQSEVVLVQSPGMAQWLQWKIAEQQGISSNINFPMPASFIWQQYVENLPNTEEQSQFNKSAMIWRLMRLIPIHLEQAEFQSLRHYLSSSHQTEQHKLYQLAYQIADLFDQYLVYRPEWIACWERCDESSMIAELEDKVKQANRSIGTLFSQHIQWQAILWRALVADILAETGQPVPLHRAYLQTQFLQFLQTQRPVNLPPRLFIFGISALPKGYLEMLYAMSQYCEVHLFFTNGCREYWGDLMDPRFMQRLSQMKRSTYHQASSRPVLSHSDHAQFASSYDNEWLFEGHPLLSSWGKLGRDFLYLLTELEQRPGVRSIDAYTELATPTLLSQVQARILYLDGQQGLNFIENDRSLTFHACHSPMREVEVLHDYLLHLFQQDSALTPKDIVVMVADIDQYTPYIQAVFGQQNKSAQTQIPFSISDNRLSANDVLIASFIHLLQLKESQLSAEEVLALLDIPAIRNAFQIELMELEHIRHWVARAGVRFGLEKEQGEQEENTNSWQAGLERMLLGYAMREENGIWQGSLGFDSCYGLQGQLAGRLADFITTLSAWYRFLQTPQPVETWQQHLLTLLTDFFAPDETNIATLMHIQEMITQMVTEIQQTHFDQPLSSEVVSDVLSALLEDDPNTMKFLVGKVNFCTLLPMRSIPFKVVCLLGMNEGDYPRQQTPNSFDLMQYDRRKGDRFRRDDDCYLFLEALLSAQEVFYVSFVGRSIVDNQSKPPSVLVSQLIDYLVDKLPPSDTQDGQARLIEQHPMTAFSPENFRGEKGSFAKQWLPLATIQKQQGGDFVQSIAQEVLAEDREIVLTNLIAFLQHPVAFFFRQHLGVYFAKQEEQIEDSENFVLDGLMRYQINEQLLYCDEKNTSDLFAQLKVKGMLPRGEFAQITAIQQEEEIAALKANVADYIAQEAEVVDVALTLPSRYGDVRLIGQLDQLYAQQRVVWRVGQLQEKYIIESWFYYLIQCAVMAHHAPPIYYAKNGHITFKPLQASHSLNVKETALAQLQIYVESYLQGYQQLQLVPTKNIQRYLAACEKADETDVGMRLTLLQQLAVGDYGAEGDIYWQRVLAQQTVDEHMLKAIDERTIAWFKLMFEHLEKA
ncbi:exodeoxyribonuclease V subunit gamma [Bisgaard Taxon 45]|uniref:RecBCD enzyme subunit RecC n=1 Tax=Bisgaard Taxon 45 TaxID=304289 RepID=A0ABT9KBW9_9PAST|nr:exodeoxyribonuclease V subunit gamma [Bisgaard Taxon 45]